MSAEITLAIAGLDSPVLLIILAVRPDSEASLSRGQIMAGDGSSGAKLVRGAEDLNDTKGDYEVISGSSLTIRGVAQSNILVRKGGQLNVYGTITGTLTNEGGDVKSFNGSKINIIHDNGEKSGWGEKGSSVNEYWRHGKTLLIVVGKRPTMNGRKLTKSKDFLPCAAVERTPPRNQQSAFPNWLHERVFYEADVQYSETVCKTITPSIRKLYKAVAYADDDPNQTQLERRSPKRQVFGDDALRVVIGSSRYRADTRCFSDSSNISSSFRIKRVELQRAAARRGLS